MVTILKGKINEIYQSVLNRDADAKGVAYYEKKIENGEMTLDDLVKEFKKTEQYKNLSKQKEFLKFTPNFKSTFSQQEIQNFFNNIPALFHTFQINDIVFPGKYSLELQMWVAQKIPLDLTGKSVLDIGCNDGFFSFLCESRGASRVLGIDSEQYTEVKKWNNKGNPNFDLMKKILNSKVEYRKMSVYDLDDLEEMFDYVLFFGVYYHLDSPVKAFQKIYPKVKESVFVSGQILNDPNPIMYFYDEDETRDPTNWWIASPSCIQKIGKRMGFKNSVFVDSIYKKKQDKTPQPKINIEKIKGTGVFTLEK